MNIGKGMYFVCMANICEAPQVSASFVHFRNIYMSYVYSANVRKLREQLFGVF